MREGVRGDIRGGAAFIYQSAMNEFVVGIGEVLWDVLPDGKKMGGAPANFAYHVSQFGLRSCLVSAVGNDADGDEMVALLAEKGVETAVERVDKPTGRVVVGLDAAGIPCYDFDTDSAWDNIPFTPRLAELAAHTRAVCFGSLAQRSAATRATIGRFLDTMPADGTLRVFDINLRQEFYTPDIVEESLRRCNILKINDEELSVVSRMLNLDAAADMTVRCRRLLERYGLRALILTCGIDGSYVFTPAEESFYPTPRVEVADTVGAGDSFTAAFVSSLLRGGEVTDAHRIAVDVSAYVCTHHGAMPILPAGLTK